MTTPIIIRQESANDYNQVFEVVRSAFGQDVEVQLVHALRNNGDVLIPDLSLVAVEGNTIVGHILFTKIKIVEDDCIEHESLALAPIAVLPIYQNKGIGSMLIKYGLERAKSLQYKSVIVLGHAHYYPKFGFEPAAKWDISSPFRVVPSHFMAMELVDGGLNQHYALENLLHAEIPAK